MHLVCLDLEGVLLPEAWVALADATGLPELKRTTRDEPDYDKLMQFRLDILQREGLGNLARFQEVIGQIEPIPGACEFVEWLTARTRLIILSDTFEEFAAPLMAKLGHPTLFCHNLIITDGEITGYKLRMPGHKAAAVRAFQGLNFTVTAAGDSYNDVGMLDQAEHAILVNPPDSLKAEKPHLPVVTNYDAFRTEIEKAIEA